jgi:hypothetical protein
MTVNTVEPVRDNTGFDAWLDEGQELAHRAASLPWAIGDWWNEGTQKFGERANLAVELFKGRYSYGHMVDAGWVAREFDGTHRIRPDISWSHCRAVMSLAPADQDELITEAKDNNWRVPDLKRAINDRFELPVGKGSNRENRKRREIPLSQQVLEIEPGNGTGADTETRALSDPFTSLSVQMGNWEGWLDGTVIDLDREPYSDDLRTEVVTHIRKLKRMLSDLERKLK